MSLTRKEILVELLRTYDEVLLDEMGQGSGYTGDRLLLLSKLYHEGTYRELERSMKVMRVERPSEWWHVVHRYLRCTRRQTMGCPECRQFTPEGVRHRHYLNGRMQKVERAPILEERWNSKVEWCEKCVLGKACPCALGRGLEYLSVEFRGEPFLPREIYDLVAA